jgi:hypothetical protein
MPSDKYSIKFKDVRQGCELYGILITNAEIHEVFEANPGLLEDLTQVGEWETCCREAFVNAIGHWLGLKGNWPLGMDTESYTQAYMQSFFLAATRVGLKLDKDSWESK